MIRIIKKAYTSYMEIKKGNKIIPMINKEPAYLFLN